MIIKDFLSLAVYGELSGVAVKKDKDAIVAFINMGMLELHKKFPIKIEEHVISLIGDVYYYDMPSNFLYATEAWGEAEDKTKDQDVSLSINEPDDPRSVYFNDWNTVQIPTTVNGSHVSILYAAKPEPVTLAKMEDGISTLDLPEALVEALLAYVGYRGHLGVKSDSQSENNAHYARFERACNNALMYGVAFPSDTMSMSGRLSDRCFV